MFTYGEASGFPPREQNGRYARGQGEGSKSERDPELKLAGLPKPRTGAGTCWGLGAHPGRGAQGGGLDIRNCGHTWAFAAQ